MCCIEWGNCLAMATLLLALFLIVLAAIPTNVRSIGVCNGMLGDNLPTAAEVVNMYKSNGITAMRIYAPDSATLTALQGTDIDLVLGVANEDLASIGSDFTAAHAWVQDNVLAYPGVSFKYIVLGNEVTGDNALNILPAMQYIYAALSSAGLNTKVSTSVSMGVVGTSYPPSQGEFSSDSSYMTSIVQYLATIDAPLLVNIHPYFTYVDNQADVSLDYALFTSPGSVVSDGPYNYQNIFDAMVDAVYSAMEKVDGGSNIQVVVSESGWPSGGGDAATVSNAQTYNQNLINHVGQGTPKKSTPLETYVFAMFNENQKPPGVEQNWGLFYPYKEPVYPISFN